jgi:hypothetical protein
MGVLYRLELFDVAALAARSREANMEEYTPDFTLDVQRVKGSCPAGEGWAKSK